MLENNDFILFMASYLTSFNFYHQPVDFSRLLSHNIFPMTLIQLTQDSKTCTLISKDIIIRFFYIKEGGG